MTKHSMDRRFLKALVAVAVAGILSAGALAMKVPAAFAQDDLQAQADPRARFAGGQAGAWQARANAMQGRAGPMRGRAGAMQGRAMMARARLDLANRALMQAEEIALTEDQQERLRNARSAHQRVRIEQEAAEKLVRLDLAELMRDEAADLAAIEQKLHEAADLRIEGQMAALRYQRGVREILTAEQLEELRELGADRARRDSTGARRRR